MLINSTNYVQCWGGHVLYFAGTQFHALRHNYIAYHSSTARQRTREQAGRSVGAIFCRVPICAVVVQQICPADDQRETNPKIYTHPKSEEASRIGYH